MQSKAKATTKLLISAVTCADGTQVVLSHWRSMTTFTTSSWYLALVCRCQARAVLPHVAYSSAFELKGIWRGTQPKTVNNTGSHLCWTLVLSCHIPSIFYLPLPRNSDAILKAC